MWIGLGGSEKEQKSMGCMNVAGPVIGWGPEMPASWTVASINQIASANFKHSWKKWLSFLIVVIKDVQKKHGIAIRMSVEKLRVMGRATQGVKLINLKGEDTIAAVAKVIKEEESDDDSQENLLENKDLSL